MSTKEHSPSRGEIPFDGKRGVAKEKEPVRKQDHVLRRRKGNGVLFERGGGLKSNRGKKCLRVRVSTGNRTWDSKERKVSSKSNNITK